MGKKRKKPEKQTFLEAYKKVRKDWGETDPVTKIIPNKKKKSRAQNKRDMNKEIKDD